ncbi:hypothetical protein EVAR_58973_1 [Eumeta japonica]|uniref:Uncharacterized protein n=1 Tax=Eumeta variegata TaxID=151549 RepID=A0A4C1YI38_EUMVA|nr:hypothetical protein EVAR_58973_1 [Eumeta japonica]
MIYEPLRRRRTTKEDVEERREEDEGRGPLTRTALAAAVGCVDSLISASDRRRSAACAACSAPPRARTLPLHNPVPPPPDAERMRGDARARGWSGVGTGMTSQLTRQNEEVEGRGSLTRTALAAAVRRVDSLISGRQARSVRPTPTRVTDACRPDPVGVHQRPTTGGRLRVQLELCLPPHPSRRAPTYAGAPLPRRRLRNDRARPRVGRRLGSGKMSNNGSKKRTIAT